MGENQLRERVDLRVRIKQFAPLLEECNQLIAIITSSQKGKIA